jgi:uncharacterized protein YjdB
MNGGVITGNNQRVAGISGYVSGLATSCYNYGRVTNNSTFVAGGLFGETTATALIRDSATIGNISVAYPNRSALDESRTGVPRNDFKKQETFVGLNFDNIWIIHPDANNGFPILRTMMGMYNITDTGGTANHPATAIRVQITLEVGQTLQLGAILTPADSASEVTYSTNRSATASVNRNGVVRARARGTANITIRAGDARQIITIRVT